MAETKLTPVFPNKQKKLDTRDPALKEVQATIDYMMERLEFKIKNLERRIKELEDV